MALQFPAKTAQSPCSFLGRVPSHSRSVCRSRPLTESRKQEEQRPHSPRTPVRSGTRWRPAETPRLVQRQHGLEFMRLGVSRQRVKGLSMGYREKQLRPRRLEASGEGIWANICGGSLPNGHCPSAQSRQGIQCRHTWFQMSWCLEDLALHLFSSSRCPVLAAGSSTCAELRLC